MILKASNCDITFEIDDTDYERVSPFTWHYQRYIRAYVKGKTVRLHNYLFGPAPTGLEWDHIDRNTTNNKREVGHSF